MAANNYVSSSEIKVFPTAFRTEYLSGKYTNEENFIGILNSLTDNSIHTDGSDGFIVSVNGKELVVVIHGYLFKIANYFELAGSGEDMWLAIRVETGANSSGALVDFDNASINLDTGGANSNFIGLKALTNKPGSSYDKSGTTVYSLKVVEHGKICERNKMKFSTKSIAFEDTSSPISFNEKISAIDAKDSEQDGELAKKQNILKPGNNSYIVANNNFDDNITLSQKAITALNSITKQPQGSANKPIYITANGEAAPITASIGKRKANENNAVVSQNVYFVDGAITAGYTVYASQNAPDNSVGQDGDFWFRYE